MEVSARRSERKWGICRQDERAYRNLEKTWRKNKC